MRNIDVETLMAQQMANRNYAAPEQRETGAEVNYLADIFSLGLILHEMFTGKLALGKDPVSIGEKYSDYVWVDQIVNRMIKSKPEDRYQTIDEIKKDLISFKQENIKRQKISFLNDAEVISKDSSFDDFLIENPIKIVKVDYNFKDSDLYINLNTQPNKLWLQLFDQSPYSFSTSLHPGLVQFLQNEMAILHINEPQAQNAINFMNEWISNANVRYKQFKENESAKIREKEKNKLIEERENLQRSIDITKKLKF